MQADRQTDRQTKISIINKALYKSAAYFNLRLLAAYCALVPILLSCVEITQRARSTLKKWLLLMIYTECTLVFVNRRAS